MSWAGEAISRLRAGETVTIYPKGGSMVPLVYSGEAVTLEPISDDASLRKGDIVLVHVAGRDYLHLILAVAPGPRFQIGNNKGHINGWVGIKSICGKKS